MASGDIGNSRGLEHSAQESAACMCAKTHIYWGGEVLLSCSVSISYSQKLVGGRKGIGQIIFRVFPGIFSKACYHPEALRD